MLIDARRHAGARSQCWVIGFVVLVFTASGIGYLVADRLVAGGTIEEADRMVWMSIIAVPVIVNGLIAIGVARASSMRASRGVTIELGHDLSITKRTGRPVFRAAWSDLTVERCSLRSPRALEGSAPTAPILFIRSGRRAISIGCLDPGLRWMTPGTGRFTFDWVCDRAGFVAVADRLGVRAELTTMR